MARTAKLKVLTDSAVRAYVKTGDPIKALHDGGGLYLRKRDAGAYWYLRLSDPATGAEQWHRMFPDDPAGHYPHKSLADARDEAARLWRTRSEGIDPRARREQTIREAHAQALAVAEAARRRLTVKDLFDHWARIELTPHVRADGKRSGRKDGGEYIRQQFERRVFPALGDVAAADVRKADVLAVLDEVKAAGKLRTASSATATVGAVWRSVRTLLRGAEVIHPIKGAGMALVTPRRVTDSITRQRRRRRTRSTHVQSQAIESAAGCRPYRHPHAGARGRRGRCPGRLAGDRPRRQCRWCRRQYLRAELHGLSRHRPDFQVLGEEESDRIA